MGSKCIVMDHVRGHAVAARRSAAATSSAATEVYLQVAASLQRIPLDALPERLAQPADWDGYIDRPSTSTSGGTRLSDSSPVIRYVIAWLRAEQAAAGALGLRPRGLPAGQHPRGRGSAAGGDRLGVHPHRRSPRGHRLLQRQPLPNSLYRADPDRFLPGTGS